MHLLEEIISNAQQSKAPVRAVLSTVTLKQSRSIQRLGAKCDRMLVQETNRVVEHREEWDTEVGKVLQQLLKPGKKRSK